MSTGHANSAEDMLSRIETMVLMAMDLPLQAVRSQIASAIDMIVHLGRLRDRSRRVLAIKEVCGVEDNGRIRMKPLFVFREEGEDEGRIIGRLERVGEPEKTGKLRAAGITLP